jgi:hypothetical protein
MGTCCLHHLGDNGAIRDPWNVGKFVRLHDATPEMTSLHTCRRKNLKSHLRINNINAINYKYGSGAKSSDYMCQINIIRICTNVYHEHKWTNCTGMIGLPKWQFLLIDRLMHLKLYAISPLPAETFKYTSTNATGYTARGNGTATRYKRDCSADWTVPRHTAIRPERDTHEGKLAWLANASWNLLQMSFRWWMMTH